MRGGSLVLSYHDVTLYFLVCYGSVLLMDFKTIYIYIYIQSFSSFYDREILKVLDHSTEADPSC